MKKACISQLMTIKWKLLETAHYRFKSKCETEFSILTIKKILSLLLDVVLCCCFFFVFFFEFLLKNPSTLVGHSVSSAKEKKKGTE